ncbi:MAG: hypothetical protein JWO10_295 [Microbacteriaceae bacterium]|nr:hypothetical protein [Microbacteriaceae bacterium]
MKNLIAKVTAGISATRARVSGRKTAAFGRWYRRRPFVGGVLTMLAGVEMFFSGQLDVGKIHVQVGVTGLQATIIPILLLVLGIMAIAMPVHRVVYGVISLVVSVYSLIGVNLGGFIVGMLLGAVGGILTVAWMPKGAPAKPVEADPVRTLVASDERR